MSNYSELLKDPRWQKRRLSVLESAGWKCSDCGATDRTLHVHHTHYVRGRKPWEYDDHDLMCLCEDCHEVLTYEVAEISAIIGRMDGFQRGIILGYCRAFATGFDDPIKIERTEIAYGVAQWYDKHGEDVDRKAAANGGVITGLEVDDIPPRPRGHETA